MRRCLISGLTAFLLMSSPAAAQQTFGITPSNTSTQSMSVTTSSSSITLDSKTGSTVVITNTGANTAYITGTATATTTGFPIPAGFGITFNFPPNTVISAITASSTTTLLVAKGSGATAITGGGSGGGGGGGAVTIANGADVAQGSTTDTPAAVPTDATAATMIALLKAMTNAIVSSIPAGTNLIGDVNLRQGGTALSATNGIFSNCLLGNAACATGTGAVGSTVQRIAVGTDTATVAGTAPAAAGLGATGSAVPSGAQYTGVLDASGGTNMLGLAGDPCQTSVKTTVPFTLATAAVKVAITGVAAKKIYVCAYELTNNAADSVAIFEATTATVCATSAVAVVGAGTSVATAATGFNFGANGGIARGNGGAQVLQTATNANDLCVAQSTATQLTGSFTYVTR